MEVVNQAFDKARQLFESVVPPCAVVIDTPTDFEVRAMKKSESGEDRDGILFGYVVKHADSITIGFNTQWKESVRKELFSAFLLQKMNHHGRIRVHEMDHQTYLDLQYVIQSLLRYYTDQGWT